MHLFLYTSPAVSIHQHSYRLSHHYMSSIFWDTPTPENNLLQFHDLLNMEWNTSMNSVIFSFLEMTLVLLFFFFQINYVITEKFLWSSPKNSMLLPDPGTIIMPCIIKTERTSPANCKHPCLHQKAIAKCTLEGSGQSNWVGCLSLALLSKYCPRVRNWRDKEGGNRGGESARDLLTFPAWAWCHGVQWHWGLVLTEVSGHISPRCFYWGASDLSLHYVVAFICAESLNSHKRFRALGQGVDTFLTSRSTKRILLLAVKSVFLWSFLCRLLQLEHEKRDTDKQRKTERQRKRKKSKALRKKEKKKPQSQTKATDWKQKSL